MSNCVVVVKWGTGGLRGDTEKEKGELVRPSCGMLELSEGLEKSAGIWVPGLGSLKLVKTAWGIPGAPAVPPPNWGSGG